MKMRPFHRGAGFTLVELVLAIAMASVFMVGIFTVLSSGVTSSRDANSDARVSLILRDISQRLRGVEFLKEDETGLHSALPNQYYDHDGRWVDQTDEELVKQNRYKVVVRKGWPETQPAGTNLMAVVVEIHWPVEPVANGGEIPAGAEPKAKFSYLVAPMTGRGWTDIDPNYVPKIEG